MEIEILFWVLVGLIAYTYLLYPLYMQIGARIHGDLTYSTDKDYLPKISILLAVHNEESIIERKITSTFASGYPVDKLELIIGSDNSTDNTNAILEKLSKKLKSLSFVAFKERRGKPEVINDLRKLASGSILILTDADIFPEKGTLNKLVAPFADAKIGLVDSKLKVPEAEGIPTNVQEKTYQYLESRLKDSESRYSGCMMGPSGGLYAIRNELYEEVPINHLVDDFFICMNILKKGYRTIVSTEATVISYITSNLKDEYRRKVRISAGNYQNLKWFAGLLIKPWKRMSFRFISHKVIRWLGPQIFIITIVLSYFLYSSSLIYFLLFILQLILILLPALDLAFQKLGMSITPLRFFTHFYLMNLALLEGLIKYIRGIKSGVWEPTKRAI